MPDCRVMFVAPSAYPLGGVADWLDYVLEGFRVLGDVSVLGLVEGGGHTPGVYLDRHPWAKVLFLSNTTGSREGRIRSMMSEIDRCRAKVVVSVNLVDVYEAVRRLRAGRRDQAPRVVMALHGLQANLIDDISRESDALDAVVATNRLSAALAAQALGDASRVHYAPYGVFAPQKPVTARPVAKGMRLLYAGRIEQEQKRVFDLPAILTGVRVADSEARLSIAGGGPMEAGLRGAIVAAGLGDCVDWLGDLDPARLTQAYRSHDALLVTSVWETGPIVAWEAMSHGLPVVSSRYIGCGLEGALVDGQNVMLFEIGDVQGAVAAISRLVDRSVRETVVSEGLALVRERYSLEASVRAWKNALEAVMAAPRKPPAAPRPSQPAGRLDRLLGVERAEDLRRLLGIRFVPDSPGAAWPHSGSGTAGQDEFLAWARQVDRGEVELG